MNVHPEIQEILDQTHAPGVPTFADMTVPEAREAVRATTGFNGPPPPVYATTTVEIPTSAGPINALRYVPSDEPDLPIVVLFHGGGWIMGDPQLIDVPARELAVDAGVIVVSAGHRLAPEHPYPAAHQDAYDVTRWVAEHAASLGGNPGRVAVAGESTGGNLAASVALRARDEQTVALAAQLLIYPVLDPDMDSESYATYGERHLLTRAAMEQFWRHYLGDAESDAYAAPAKAASLAGLPPTTLMVADHDPLVDEGLAYASRLRADGVSTELVVGEGLTHAAWYMGGVSAAARDWAREGHRRLAAQLAAQRQVGSSAPTLTRARIDREAGMELMAELQDPDFQDSWTARSEGVAPGFADWIVQAAFGGLYQRPGLDLQQRQLLNLAALTTLGTEPQLAGHIRTSLRVGLAPDQIAEALVHLAIYAGVPRTLNALAVARAVFAEQEQPRGSR